MKQSLLYLYNVLIYGTVYVTILPCIQTLSAQTPEQEGLDASVFIQRPSEPIPLGPVKIESIDAPGVAVAEHQQGFMWFGGGTGGGGLYRYDGYEFIQYQSNPQDTTSLAHDWVESLYVDSSGTFWVGTFGDGLHLFDRETSESVRYGPEEGLASVTVANLLENDEGYLWISTVEGSLSRPRQGRLSRFNPDSETFTNYGVTDGLPNIGFFINAALKNRDGRLFFGGSGGFTAFDPQTIPEPVRHRPKMTLAGLRVRNKEVKPHPEGLPETPSNNTKRFRYSYEY